MKLKKITHKRLKFSDNRILWNIYIEKYMKILQVRKDLERFN